MMSARAQRDARGWLALALAALLLPACSSTIEVESAFPAPLVETLPARVGLLYSDEFAHYVHVEKEGHERSSWRFALGPGNVRLFDGVFGRLFAGTVRVQDTAAAGDAAARLDAVVAPAVDAVEVAEPGQSHTNQYAVWIRYRVRVYGRDGQLVEDWPVSAYGQSEDRGLTGTASMARAAGLALRDAEATIAVQFAQQPKIRAALLRENADAKP